MAGAVRVAMLRKTAAGRSDMPDQTTGIRIEHARVPGRLRLHVAALRRHPERARALAADLAAQGPIAAAEARAWTGSVILRVDPAAEAESVLRLVGERLERLAGAGWADPSAPRPGAASERREGGPKGEPWHARPAGAVAAALEVDPRSGLTEAQARARLARSGPNVMPRDEPPSNFALLAKQFQSLPVLMLASSAAVSIGTGGLADAVATLSVVAVNGVLGFVTEGQAERVIHELMAPSRHNLRALRDGEEVTVPARVLVPGDVLVIRAGTQVGADARLVSASDLRIDESVLTGESLPVAKAAEAALDARTPLAERCTMLYAGTIVAEGEGRAVVVATGARTEAARTLLLSAEASRPQAPVEAELDRFGRRLAIASLGACALFAGLAAMRGYATGAVLKDALALAVAAVPEGLPMVATTALSLGLRRMERKGILIRQMQVVESLGAIQSICLDKTGTLTENRMRVVEVLAGTAIADPADAAAVGRLAEIAALNNDAGIAAGRAAGSSQTEQALLNFAIDLQLDVAALRTARPRARTAERRPGQPWMATIHEGEGTRFTVKGAPEAILEHCTHVLEDGEPQPITPEDRRRILRENERIASRPARVIGFAERVCVPEGGALSGLTFVGLVGMIDPIRPGAKAFIRRLHRAGIDAVLITGDQAATANATARALGLARDGHLRTVDSTKLAGLSPDLLAGLAREVHVFARVASSEKLAIVKALQRWGRVVAMTGDGVNDGPALNAADVGIAMGQTGADLAREVANVVIRDDELGTLIEAIAQGRALYRNIRRSLEFLVTTNMSEILVSIAEVLHGPGELETPMELLWINMVTDVLPGLGLALADPDRDMMRRPPRPVGEPIVPRRDAYRMGRDGATMAAAALGAHFVGLARYGPGPETRGMTFLALSQGQLLYTLVCQRSDPRKLQPGRIFENRKLDLALTASSALGLAPFISPTLSRLLGIARLTLGDAAVGLTAAALPFATVLARRGVQNALEELESEPCETSS